MGILEFESAIIHIINIFTKILSFNNIKIHRHFPMSTENLYDLKSPEKHKFISNISNNTQTKKKVKFLFDF